MLCYRHPRPLTILLTDFRRNAASTAVMRKNQPPPARALPLRPPLENHR